MGAVRVMTETVPGAVDGGDLGFARAGRARDQDAVAERAARVEGDAGEIGDVRDVGECRLLTLGIDTVQSQGSVQAQHVDVAPLERATRYRRQSGGRKLWHDGQVRLGGGGVAVRAGVRRSRPQWVDQPKLARPHHDQPAVRPRAADIDHTRDLGHRLPRRRGRRRRDGGMREPQADERG